MIKRIFDYKGELMKCENVQLKSQYEEQIRTSYNNLKLENEQLKSNYKKLQRWLKRKHLPS